MLAVFYDQPIAPATNDAYALRIQDFANAIFSRNATINLSSSSQSGILLLGNNNVEIGGYIFSNASGIVCGSNSVITLTATASLYSSGNQVIELLGTNNIIINEGALSSSAYAVTSLTSGPNTLYNNGVIHARNIISADQLTVVNTGTMVSSSTAIFGGNENDQVTNSGWIQCSASFNPIALNLAGGNDVYHGETGHIVGMIQLGSGDDQAYGGSGSETFRGDAGNDYLDGGAGIDTAVYNTTTTAVRVDLGNTGWQLTGEAYGTDLLINIENVTSFGSGGDTLIGNSVDNVLTSSGGNDTLEGGLGDDILNGGSEEDTARYTGSAGAVVSLELQGQKQNTGGYGLDTLIGIENLSGGSGNDVLTGNGEANRLSGNAGNDALNQKENDGNDVLDGGSGIDVVSFLGGTGATVNLALTSAQLTGYGSDVFIGIENLSGSSANDRFTGNGAANRLSGNSGDDMLSGGIGSDTLTGGAGNDQLYGGTDAGRDVFVFNTALSSRDNKDAIRDWNYRYDTIQLENAVFGRLTKTGVLNKAYFVLGAGAKDSNDYVGYNKSTGDLWYDANGNKAGGQVVFANIGKNKPIFHSDFIVI